MNSAPRNWPKAPGPSTRTIARYRPRVVAILGVTAYRTAFAVPRAALGRQPEDLHGSQLWVVPNPSGRNAHAPLDTLAAAYREVAQAAGHQPVASGGSRVRSAPPVGPPPPPAPGPGQGGHRGRLGFRPPWPAAAGTEGGAVSARARPLVRARRCGGGRTERVPRPRPATVSSRARADPVPPSRSNRHAYGITHDQHPARARRGQQLPARPPVRPPGRGPDTAVGPGLSADLCPLRRVGLAHRPARGGQVRGADRHGHARIPRGAARHRGRRRPRPGRRAGDQRAHRGDVLGQGPPGTQDSEYSHPWSAARSPASRHPASRIP